MQKQDKYYGVDGVGSIDEITERECWSFDKLCKLLKCLNV